MTNFISTNIRVKVQDESYYFDCEVNEKPKVGDYLFMENIITMWDRVKMGEDVTEQICANFIILDSVEPRKNNGGDVVYFCSGSVDND
jgi:hypothetical protein